jgi:hypothetical protein
MSKFIVPPIEEVSAYIEQKMKWPKAFCDYYAEKFWNHYEAQGWKLSNGNAMKNWQAAFASQWQTPKYQEDILFFAQCKKVQVEKKHTVADYLNERLADYKKNWDVMAEESLVALYDYIKEHGLAKFTKEEVQEIRQYAQGDVVKGKALSTRTLFNRMLIQEQRF